MKRSVVLLVLSLAIGAIFFGIGYWWCTGRPHHSEIHSHRELVWLELEFQLNPEQMEKITQLHRKFLPVCDELCMRIIKVNEQLSRRIAADRTMTPEISALMADASRIHQQSREAVLNHLFEVSAEMTPSQAERYLQAMMPQILDVPYNKPESDKIDP